MEQQELTKKEKFIKELKSTVVIVIAILAFRSTCFEPFRIPSGSMIPTLMIGDFILVNKMSYGIKLPFSDIGIGPFNWKPIYLFGESKPKKGDVIVFKYPQDYTISFIKRVVATPGDTVEVKNKIVYVNDQVVQETPVDGTKYMDDMDDSFRQYNLKFFETSSGEAKHIVQHDNRDIPEEFRMQDPRFYMEKRTVPKGSYFAMGDNRDFSMDSRYWGFVPHEYIKGKAILVWFSMIFPFIEENPFKLRWWRIGNLIK